MCENFEPIGSSPHSDPQGAPGASGLKGDKVDEMLLTLSCASVTVQLLPSFYNPLSFTESPYTSLVSC